jgi:putative flippase GtrA
VIRFFLTRQFLRFAMVGGVAAVLHWLARIVLSAWMPLSPAVVGAYGVGMAVAFGLNSVFVFPDSPKPRLLQARDFLLVNLSFFPLVWLMTLGLSAWFRSLGWLDIADMLAHGISVVVPAFLTFLFYKFFAFKDVAHGRR